MGARLEIKDSFLDQIRDLVRLSLADLTDVSVPADFLSQLTIPPDFALGQAALPCFALAKVMRMAPPKIAAELCRIAKAHMTKTPLIADVQVASAYLNFFFNFEQGTPELFSSIHDGRFFKGPFIAGPAEKISVEYSQPNTHKALHVGHLRNMVYGDAVCRLLEYVGHKVVRTTYPGDMGAHIAKTLWYIDACKRNEYERQLATAIAEEQMAAHDGIDAITRAGLPTPADWLGDVYALADDALKKIEGTPKETESRKAIGEILRAMQSRQGPFYEMYRTTRQWSLDQLHRIYNWLGIHFDIWFFESECDETSRELVLKKFQEGFFTKSQGAIGIDLSAHNLGYALFLKSDGNGLYLTKDLELIRQKFLDPDITSSIVVVDSRQKLHFQQLFKTAELMGYPQAARSVHLSYESVTTEDGSPFSSRSQNGLHLEQFRRRIEQIVIERYLESYRGEWPDAQIEDTARMIALGALKYGMLRVDASSPIKFILDDWLKLDGDTGPYLQYVHTRCMSVMAKLGPLPALPKRFVFEHPVESKLIMWLARFNKEAATAGVEYRPSTLAAYLYDLCKLFNQFYKECPIKTAPSDELRQCRQWITASVANVLKRGLGLLGIPAPEKM